MSLSIFLDLSIALGTAICCTFLTQVGGMCSSGPGPVWWTNIRRERWLTAAQLLPFYVRFSSVASAV